MARKDNVASMNRYAGMAEPAVASGALSLEKSISPLAVSGTVAYTLARPNSLGQYKYVYTDTAVSTPVATLAVASCKGVTGAAATRTFSGFGTITASAPKSLELLSVKHPTEGLVWIVTGMVGGLTVA